MGKRTSLLARALIMGLLPIALLGTGAASAQSGEVCNPNGALALADGNGDGVVSLGELEELNALAGGNADLEATISKAAAQGITGIRYTGCTPDAGSGGTDTGTGDTGSGGTGNGASDTGAGNTGSSNTNTTTSSAVTGADGKPGKASSSVSGASSSQADVASQALVVTRLPAVGSGEANDESASGILVASVGGLLALAGGLTFRLGRKA